MKRNLSVSLFLLLFLVSPLFSQKTTWQFYTFMDNQIFPSYAWSVAQLANDMVENEAGNFYGDANAQIAAYFPELKKGSKVKVVVESPEIMDKSVLEFEMAATRKFFFAAPQILYNWTALNTWVQPKPVTIKISVFLNGQLLSEQSKSITVRSINDCPYISVTDFGAMVDLNYNYTAYVNENHPLIANVILKEILDKGIINKVLGYQGGTEDVYQQVYAVWDYFNRNEFHYSSLNSYFKGNVIEFPNVQAQYVRTFEEVYATKQANCVEGTILMASILMRMGIDPYLVTTPNHCYLGFSLDGTNENLRYLETTLLGEDLEQAPEEDQEVCKNFNLLSNDMLYRLTLGKNTYDNFIWALLTGQLNFDNDKDLYDPASEGAVIMVDEDNALETFKQLNYQQISVKKYRQEGLLPLTH